MIDIAKAPWNAPSDGSDATQAIQAALRSDDPDVLFPSGMSFKVKKLMIPSATRLHMQGATLWGSDQGEVNNWLLATELGATGIRILGGVLRGDTQENPLTRFSVLLRLDDAEDVVVDGLEGRGAKTEALSITGNRGCERIYVRDSKFLNCRRGGASVVHGSEIEFLGCEFSGNSGNPGAGCDVEPNSGQQVDGVRFIRCQFNDNQKGLYAHKGLGLAGENYSVIGCEMEGNKEYGAIFNSIHRALIAGCTFAASPIGVSIGSNTEAARASDIRFIDNLVVGCGRALILAGIKDSYIIKNELCGRIEEPVLGTSGDMVFLGNSRI